LDDKTQPVDEVQGLKGAAAVLKITVSKLKRCLDRAENGLAALFDFDDLHGIVTSRAKLLEWLIAHPRVPYTVHLARKRLRMKKTAEARVKKTARSRERRPDAAAIA
jgi:hypothetical protein